MKKMMKMMAPVLSLAVLGASSAALAGSKQQVASCYAYADGSGRCSGNLLGFRNEINSTTYARFYEYDYGTRYFYAAYTVAGATGPSYYSCTPNAAVAAMWDQALALNTYFYITWDVNGTCDYLALTNGSQYANF